MSDLPTAAPAQFDDLGAGATNNIPADLSVIADVSLTVDVVLGRARMRVTDLLQLRAGAVVELGPAGGTVEVLANGSLVGRGEVVVVGDELGVRITEVVHNQTRR